MTDNTQSNDDASTTDQTDDALEPHVQAVLDRVGLPTGEPYSLRLALLDEHGVPVAGTTEYRSRGVYALVREELGGGAVDPAEDLHVAGETEPDRSLTPLPDADPLVTRSSRTEPTEVELENGSTVTYHDHLALSEVQSCSYHHPDEGACEAAPAYIVSLQYNENDARLLPLCAEHAGLADSEEVPADD